MNMRALLRRHPVRIDRIMVLIATLTFPSRSCPPPADAASWRDPRSHGSPPMVLPSTGRASAWRIRNRGLQQFAQEDGVALMFGSSMPIRVAPLHHRDAGRDRAHRAGNVVGEPDHAARFGARGRLKLVERDHRTGAHVDDLAPHAEILQRRFGMAGILLQRLCRDVDEISNPVCSDKSCRAGSW